MCELADQSNAPARDMVAFGLKTDDDATTTLLLASRALGPCCFAYGARRLSRQTTDGHGTVKHRTKQLARKSKLTRAHTHAYKHIWLWAFPPARLASLLHIVVAPPFILDLNKHYKPSGGQKRKLVSCFLIEI